VSSDVTESDVCEACLFSVVAQVPQSLYRAKSGSKHFLGSVGRIGVTLPRLGWKRSACPIMEEKVTFCKACLFSVVAQYTSGEGLRVL